MAESQHCSVRERPSQEGEDEVMEAALEIAFSKFCYHLLISFFLYKFNFEFMEYLSQL